MHPGEAQSASRIIQKTFSRGANLRNAETRLAGPALVMRMAILQLSTVHHPSLSIARAMRSIGTADPFRVDGIACDSGPWGLVGFWPLVRTGS